MKLTAKILLLLLSAIIPVIVFFAGLGIYFFNNTLKEEARASHKLMYSLFLPTLTTYLWEFDTDGIRSTISNIMKNNYATDIYVYDMDASLILGYSKNIESDTIREVKDENESEFKNYIKKIEKNIKSADNEQFNLIALDDSLSNTKVIGILYHKKVDGNVATPIGYAVFNYSNKAIQDLIKKSIFSIVAIAFFIAIVLVVLISILLRKTLIENIILLNKASLTIATGEKKTIKEKGGHDEIADLIRNFNIMADQIDQNQENLKLIAEEGIKISSSLTIELMVQQIKEAINKISKSVIDLDFYVSNNLLDKQEKEGFIKINIINNLISYDNLEIIPFGDEYQIPPGVKRTFVRDTRSGMVSAIIELKNLGDDTHMYFKQEERLHSSVQALQVSAASALSTMSFIHNQKEQLRLVAESETARLVQMNLLPPPDLKKFSCFEIVSHFQSATECAGDWWSAYQLPEDKLLILLGDVTGHGTASAILTAVVKGYCDSLCQQPNISTTEILLQLDKIVFNIGKGERVMTMFAAILDPALGVIEFSNAAHNFPFIVRSGKKDRNVDKLIAHGKPLGFDSAVSDKDKDKMRFAPKAARFELNDILVIFTDGLVEAMDKEGTEFSERTLKKILEQGKDKSILEIREDILSQFQEFTSNTTLADDMTFVVCRHVR